MKGDLGSPGGEAGREAALDHALYFDVVFVLVKQLDKLCYAQHAHEPHKPRIGCHVHGRIAAQREFHPSINPSCVLAPPVITAEY